MGYFRRGAVNPYIEEGQLELIEDAPVFTYPVYAVYPEFAEERRDVQAALQGLKAVAH